MLYNLLCIFGWRNTNIVILGIKGTMFRCYTGTLQLYILFVFSVWTSDKSEILFKLKSLLSLLFTLCSKIGSKIQLKIIKTITLVLFDIA